ncbi:MAG: hypothetical protein IPJ65_12100 [Archangiaceae bacterium]|nr:hypothetical protein [Archangiaceae bacterium]
MSALVLCALLSAATPAGAKGAKASLEPAPAAVEPAADEAGAEDEAAQNGSDGYTPPAPTVLQALRFTGYVDVGFAAAQGNGSSFPAGDFRVPADYGVDAFAPAVNSRGEVASTDARGRFTNGFLPRSLGIGSTPSFFLSTASLDARFAPTQVPVMVFMRMQLMPRFYAGGDGTRFDLQQAFGKVTPFSSAEFTLSVGRFDSVFGIEYLENEANLRTGITPSLIARYTTGRSLGAKLFYRLQLAPLWSALSLNVAATNSGTRVEELMGPDLSLTGVPVGSARLGYELNLQRVQVKLGGSGLVGPRNDTRNPSVKQWAYGVDLRISAVGFTVSAELIHLVDEQPAGATRDLKRTGTGAGEIASGFQVSGGYVQLQYALPLTGEYFSGLALYGRYDRRNAAFHGFTGVRVDRFTVGARLELFSMLAIKAEGLFNRELSGAPDVPNDVFTSSVVFTW